MAGARRWRTRSSVVGGGVPSSGDAGSGSSRGGWPAQQSIVDAPELDHVRVDELRPTALKLSCLPEFVRDNGGLPWGRPLFSMIS